MSGIGCNNYLGALEYVAENFQQHVDTVNSLNKRIVELEAALQKCVDETVAVIGGDALEEAAYLLEESYEPS
jgi:hypothetical protein